jgi:hypothetical protein
VAGGQGDPDRFRHRGRPQREERSRSQTRIRIAGPGRRPNDSEPAGTGLNFGRLFAEGRPDDHGPAPASGHRRPRVPEYQKIFLRDILLEGCKVAEQNYAGIASGVKPTCYFQQHEMALVHTLEIIDRRIREGASA